MLEGDGLMEPRNKDINLSRYQAQLRTIAPLANTTLQCHLSVLGFRRLFCGLQEKICRLGLLNEVKNNNMLTICSYLRWIWLCIIVN
jgi:hypothetical protein